VLNYLTALKRNNLMTRPYKAQLRIVKLNKLKQHEEVDPIHLKELKEEIWSDKILKFAIVADKNTNIILDGQHRFNALKELGCKRIPVVYIDYNSPAIEVQSWKGNPHLTKKDVIEAGLSGRKFPPKTSKHMVWVGDSLLHISAIEKRVNIPIEKLR
jgi:ParB-like chromosome segregation protein Spo0J